jgi:Endonuclease/Exonuclease/phosphatase family
MGLALGGDLVPALGLSAPPSFTVGSADSGCRTTTTGGIRREEQIMSSGTRPFGRRRRGVRRIGSVLLLLASQFVLSPGVAPAQAAGSELTVMTRNLSFGTDLGPILAATDQLEFVTAVAAAYTQALATDFPGRARAWAAEIEHTRPDLVALQEAVLWRTQTPADFSPTSNATTVQADLVGLLLAELRSRGLKYEVVIAQTGFDIEAPGLFPAGLVDVRLTQREVILVRKSAGLRLANAHGGQYAAFLTIPTRLGVPVSLPWAWASVDATLNGRSFRFATTHLDPISGAAQGAQAAEFLAGPGATTLPIVWLGDFNSDADATVVTGVPSATATYGSIIAAGFADAWKAKHPSDPGFTCCQATNLLNPVSTLTERDDLVLTRGPFHVGRASIVGAETTDRLASGLWPSDHAGVVVTLELENGG